MLSIDNALRTLARRMYGEDSAAASNRETLEATLLPMIRCAMRTGRGAPPLVQWVKRNLPAVAPAARLGQAVDPEWAAPRMARLLSSRLLQEVQAEPVLAGACETVVSV
jgi:hypothetical protein